MSRATSQVDRPLRSMVLPALTALSLAGLIACGGGSNGASSADTASTGGTAQAGASRDSLRAQLERVEKKLNAISERAMQDTALQREREEVLELYRKAIREVSDPAARRLARLDTVESELEAARAEGNATRMQALMKERQELEAGLKRARETAMDQEVVQKALKEYQNRVRARMRELDPAADSLLQLADSLQERLRSQDQGGTRGAGAADTAGG